LTGFCPSPRVAKDQLRETRGDREGGDKMAKKKAAKKKKKK
jgi:hypothetical protein